MRRTVHTMLTFSGASSAGAKTAVSLSRERASTTPELGFTLSTGRLSGAARSQHVNQVTQYGPEELHLCT